MYFRRIVGFNLFSFRAIVAHLVDGSGPVDRPSVVQDGTLDGIYSDGAFRITAATDRLIRIEYDEAGVFVNERTIAFLRSPPEGKIISSINDAGWVTVNTSKVSVRYLPGRPREGSVVVSSRTDARFLWTWGDDPEKGNLRGTARTLDGDEETLNLNCFDRVSSKIPNHDMHCAWGIISRDGWSIVNETGAPVIRNGWFEPSTGSIDVFVFLHGHDYASAMLDYFKATGPPTLPPRYAFGTLFTRWYNFDADSVRRTVDGFESRSFPLDAWVFDMNWHLYGPWGSFSWNENSFPGHQDVLDWLQTRRLLVGANMHEHDGVNTYERTYGQVCQALHCTPGHDIPFDLYNKSYADAQENISVRALDTQGDRQGMDFYWIDYQQGEADVFQQTRIPQINPTIVLNMIRSEGPVKHGENRRSMIVSRWGGYGSHRYPVGFSGDQLHSWKGLGWLPYFTSTAANVGFNYWSHDTVGGSGKFAQDFDLAVRWTQMSAWSPVLRYHDKGEGTGGCAVGDGCARILPWDVPSPFFEAIRDAANLRLALLPYIYTAAWLSEVTGLALCRPMYYENPEDPLLYDLPNQYLFGPNMIVSPITCCARELKINFPQALTSTIWKIQAPNNSMWFDVLNGHFVSGQTSVGIYGIRDVPRLVRQGVVVPMKFFSRETSSLARAREPIASLELRIMPAEAFYTGERFVGAGVVIDDDGTSLDYRTGRLSQIFCYYVYSAGHFEFKINQEGDFEGRPRRVNLRVAFVQLPPIHVTDVQNLTVIQPSSYDRDLFGSVLEFPSVDLNAGVGFKARIDARYGSSIKNFVHTIGRARRARYVKDALDQFNVNYGANRANLTTYVLAAINLISNPDFAKSLPDLWSSVVEEVQTVSEPLRHQDPDRWQFVTNMIPPAIGNSTPDSQIFI